jgi:hypothetical protein
MIEHKATWRAANTHPWLAKRKVVYCSCGWRCDRHRSGDAASRCAVRHEKHPLGTCR